MRFVYAQLLLVFCLPALAAQDMGDRIEMIIPGFASADTAIHPKKSPAEEHASICAPTAGAPAGKGIGFSCDQWPGGSVVGEGCDRAGAGGWVADLSGVGRDVCSVMPLTTVRRVPLQYPTIQAAIDASAHGDTVLVSDGIYYENINFRGRRITVGSMFLGTGDTLHRDATIIDGSHATNPDSGAVVAFASGEDTNSVLVGFTIRDGSGLVFLYSGIPMRVGGGICILGSGARIRNTIICRNRIYGENVYGGGVFALGSGSTRPVIIIEQSRIIDNHIQGWGTTYSSEGGGVSLVGMSPRILSNTIERDSVVSATQANGGGVFFWGTIDGLPPYAGGLICGNTVAGNTVQAGTSGAVGAGVGIARTGAVVVSSNVFVENAGVSTTGWAQGAGLLITDEGISGYQRKSVTGNYFVRNRLMRGGGAATCGSGMFVLNTATTVDGNLVEENMANGEGGGIVVSGSSCRVQNNILFGNSSMMSGGAMVIESSPVMGTEQLVVNNTVFDNSAVSYAGGMLIRGTANVIVFNNIFWADSSSSNREIYVTGSTHVMYCDVDGGFFGEGNINQAPRFVEETFRLSDDSPCIGAGVDSLLVGGIWYVSSHVCYQGEPRPSPAGSYPDLGACENSHADPVAVLESRDVVPTRFELMQNYPNPFNPSTTINYDLPIELRVRLKIFDILGREVATLINEEQKAGFRSIEWNATGFASGVYFCRLQAGDFSATRKLLLLR